MQLQISRWYGTLMWDQHWTNHIKLTYRIIVPNDIKVNIGIILTDTPLFQVCIFLF
jgi:hypothetical protein